MEHFGFAPSPLQNQSPNATAHLAQSPERLCLYDSEFVSDPKKHPLQNAYFSFSILPYPSLLHF